MLPPFYELPFQSLFQLPKEDKFSEWSRGCRLRCPQQNDLLLPHRAFHGYESNIPLRHLSSHAPHVADNTVNFMIFALKKVKTILNPFTSQSLKLFSQESLMLCFGNVISKHHEHGARRAERPKGSVSEELGQKTPPPSE